MILSSSRGRYNPLLSLPLTPYRPLVDWTAAPHATRKAHIVYLLENLEHQDSWVRYQTARRLLYLLQGMYGPITLVILFSHRTNFNRFLCRKHFPGEPVTMDSRKCKFGQGFTGCHRHRRCTQDALRQTRSTYVRPISAPCVV